MVRDVQDAVALSSRVVDDLRRTAFKDTNVEHYETLFLEALTPIERMEAKHGEGFRIAILNHTIAFNQISFGKLGSFANPIV